MTTYQVIATEEECAAFDAAFEVKGFTDEQYQPRRFEAEQRAGASKRASGYHARIPEYVGYGGISEPGNGSD
jgi:hypothetical protein